MTIKRIAVLGKRALLLVPLLMSHTIAQAEYFSHYPVQLQPVSLQQHTGWAQTNTLPPEIQPYYAPTTPAAVAGNPQQGFDLPWQQSVNRLAQPQWQPQPAPMPNQHLSSARQRVLDTAFQQMGVRYRWGGNTPRQGFDCSGFTKYAHKQLNLNIPRTAAEQSAASKTIRRQDLRPGDMIFFKTSGRRVNHVGIYLGNGRFIHAASGGGKVMTDDLRKAYWQKRLHKYGTFLG